MQGSFRVSQVKCSPVGAAVQGAWHALLLVGGGVVALEVTRRAAGAACINDI